MAFSHTWVINLYSNSFPVFPTLPWAPCSPLITPLLLPDKLVPFHAMWQLGKELKVSYLPQLHSFTKFNSDLTLQWALTLQVQASLKLPYKPDEGPAQSLQCPCTKDQFSQLWLNASCHQVKSKSTDLHVQILDKNNRALSQTDPFWAPGLACSVRHWGDIILKQWLTKERIWALDSIPYEIFQPC